MRRLTVCVILVLFVVPAGSLWAQKTATLTDDEEDKLREAQDPSQRIQVYLDFLQARLDRFEGFRSKPLNSVYDNGAYLDALLDQYIALNDELKNWIDDQYQHNGDMRKGLRALLERGPKQLEMLEHIRETPDALAADYRDSLRDAVNDLKDTLDGATRALADQEKKFVDAKREEKLDARSAKERAKEEHKRTKEEKKLRKKEHKRGVPAQEDEEN